MCRGIIQVKKEKLLFRLFFLKEEDQSVEVEEVEKIDFEVIERRLKQGESVFITHKNNQEFEANSVTEEDAADPWYFLHI